jgi:hypothetical protein
MIFFQKTGVRPASFGSGDFRDRASTKSAADSAHLSDNPAANGRPRSGRRAVQHGCARGDRRTPISGFERAIGVSREADVIDCA